MRRKTKIRLTQEDCNKTIAVRVGSKMIIELDENPSTGYRWKISLIGKEILGEIDSRFLLNTNSAVGGGGKRTFTFAIQKVGSIKLHLKKLREWEGDASTIERCTFLINASR